MVKVISFCIYGAQQKYCLGLLKNLELIQTHFPDYQVWIYAGNNVPEEYREKYKRFSNVKYISTGIDGGQLTCYRFFAIDDPEVEIMHCRDADSRVTERDQYLIRQFEKSDELCHIIREHFWHKDEIQAGMWGLKKGILAEKIQDIYNVWLEHNKSMRDQFRADQKFLKTCIYPSVKDQSLIHSNIVGFQGENITFIDVPRKDDFDFIGNVILFDKDRNEYPEFRFSEFNLPQHLQWLLLQNRWDLVTRLTKYFCESEEAFFKYPSQARYTILDSIYVSYYYLQDIQKCKEVLSKYRWAPIEEHTLRNSSHLLHLERQLLGKRIIGTTDPLREPGPSEIVICYGNYPHDVYNLPNADQPNKLYRHAIYKDFVHHDAFEYHPCWNKIDQIYVLNLKVRKDRWMEILVELCKMGAPLDRIYHYEAPVEVVTGKKQVDKYLGATKNHLDVVEHFLANNFQYCLIVEDDLTFTTDIPRHQHDLAEFFDREYDFDVCLISSSKYHELRPHDDLLVKSYQVCTTTSGYILKKETARRVYECFKEGYEQIKTTHQYHSYVCDRYWSKLQKDNKFFLFKRKFGYQRANYSSITETIDCHFD